MAQAKAQDQNVDLFGNSTLTPRQLVQQQLAKLMEDTAARTASMDQRAQGTSMMGAAAGGLIGEALIGAGVLPEPPERARARKFQEVQGELHRSLSEEGMSPETHPLEVADRATALFFRAGLEKEAGLATQWGLQQAAIKRAADAERAKIANTEADTKLKLADAANGGSRGRGGYAVPVTDKDGTVLEFDTRAPSGERLRDPLTGQPLRRSVKDPRYEPGSQRRLAANKKAGEEAGEEQRLLDGKLDALDAISQAQGMLDDGIYSGGWAEWQMGAAKLGPLDKTRAANTERFQAYLGDVIIPGLKEFGGNDSNEERQYLEKVRGGKVTMEEPALRKILETAERKITRGIARARKRANESGLPADEAPRKGDKSSPGFDADGVPTPPAKLPAGWKVKVK